MLTLAALRYRNVLAKQGGPIAEVVTGKLNVRGRPMALANARLSPGLGRKNQAVLFGNADGTGTHRVPSVARHMAISEALERWAFSATVRSERAQEFGFDIDPSTNGMSAYPGLLKSQARRKAMLEAVERFSLMAWWEGRLPGRLFDTDWPGVSAVVIDGPLGGITTVVFSRSEWGGWVYGHAADESFGAACERAIIEMARQEWVLRARWLAEVAGEKRTPVNIFERRCLFFATDEGHELFRERIARTAIDPVSRPEVICDAEIPRPWDDYATVWRVALRPLSDGYIRGGDGYFFL